MTKAKQPPSPYVNERVEAIAVTDIITDHTYQRDLNHALVRRIITDLNMPAFGVLLLVMRPDTCIACCDGQHRLEAARELGWEWVPAVLVAVETPAEEARLFLDANRRGTISAVDRHRALMRAGDETALRIETAVSTADLRIDLGRVDSLDGQQTVRAVGKLYFIDAHYSGEMITRVLRIMRDAWHGESYEGKLMHALAIVLATYVHDVHADGAVSRRLSRKPLADVITTARANAPRHPDVMTYAKAIVKVHNRSRGPKFNPWVLDNGERTEPPAA